MMAHIMIDEGQMKAAQMWLTVAEEKLELFKDDTTREVVDITKEILAVHIIEQETHELSENLCKKLKTTVHEENFQSSSISCRFVQEGGIPFSLRKYEDLSVEPPVYLIHDFLSKQEADHFMIAFENIEYSPNSVNMTTFRTSGDDGALGELIRIVRQR